MDNRKRYISNARFFVGIGNTKVYIYLCIVFAQSIFRASDQCCLVALERRFDVDVRKLTKWCPLQMSDRNRSPWGLFRMSPDSSHLFRFKQHCFPPQTKISSGSNLKIEEIIATTLSLWPLDYCRCYRLLLLHASPMTRNTTQRHSIERISKNNDGGKEPKSLDFQFRRTPRSDVIYL